MKLKPLEWWRNEHVIYERRKSSSNPLPTIKDVVRVDPEPLPERKRSGRSKRRLEADGFEEVIDSRVTVLDADTGVEVELGSILLVTLR